MSYRMTFEQYIFKILNFSKFKNSKNKNFGSMFEYIKGNLKLDIFPSNNRIGIDYQTINKIWEVESKLTFTL